MEERKKKISILFFCSVKVSNNRIESINLTIDRKNEEVLIVFIETLNILNRTFSKLSLTRISYFINAITIKNTQEFYFIPIFFVRVKTYLHKQYLFLSSYRRQMAEGKRNQRARHFFLEFIWHID